MTNKEYIIAIIAILITIMFITNIEKIFRSEQPWENILKEDQYNMTV
jgi:hypothetical protein